MSLVAAFFLVVTCDATAQEPAAGGECESWQRCRALALEAAERREYEVFHDLAWRAVQKGPKNDADLMTMLARAQSLSGRPHDALVMLHRLAAMGIATDAATSEDFRRVRSLAGWEDLKRKIEEIETRPVQSRSETTTIAPERPAGRSTAMETKTSGGSPAERRPEPKEAPNRKAAAEEPLSGDAADLLRFTTAVFVPSGLAYDDVSDRFIVADRKARKLTVVDEASHRVANLAGAQTAGFGEIGALEIDPREGDLWVVSTGAVDEGAGRNAALHKLQLVSGRVLYALSLPESFGKAHFADVAVTPNGTVVVVDALGQRLFTVPARSRKFALAGRLTVEGIASVAPESDAIVYIAHEKGLARVDLSTKRTTSIRSAKQIDLTGLTRIRWHRGSLIGLQKSGGNCRVVRIRLDDAARRATALEVLDRFAGTDSATAGALSGDVFYYLVPTTNAEGDGKAAVVVRRVSVR
jgi:hypothetical protein